MRWMAAVVVVLGCGGAPDVPARLEEVADIPQTGQDLPAAFDTDDTLVLMDGNTGLRRLVGDRLLSIPNGSQFSFGTMGIDRDGVLLLGSSNFTQLARLEPADAIVLITPQPPTSFTRIAGTPSGAYHILPFGAATTFTLPAGGTAWVDSMLGLDRTLRAPDGTIYAILDGDIVTLGADDSPTVVASCAEFAGGTCPGLELAGVDSAGHVHMALSGLPEVHVLDPAAGTYRDIALPGELVIESMVAGSQHALVLANDPERNNERSVWLLPDGGDQLLRFATVGAQFEFGFVRVLADRSGNTFLISNGKLQRVVVD